MITKPGLDASLILDNVRPLVLVVEHDGVISEAHGAADGVAGYRTEQFVGTHALDFVTEADRLELMHIFVPIPDRTTSRNSSAFPLRVIGPNGERELVDVLPRVVPGDERRWVLTIMPRRDHPTPIRVLDMLLDGASLETVLSALVTHQAHSTREARVDPHIVLRPDRPDRLVISPERNLISERPSGAARFPQRSLVAPLEQWGQRSSTSSRSSRRCSASSPSTKASRRAPSRESTSTAASRH